MQGTQFEFWEDDYGGKKLQTVMCAVFGYAKAYAENKWSLLDVMMQVHLLEVRHVFVFVFIILCLPSFLHLPPPK